MSKRKHARRWLTGLAGGYLVLWLLTWAIRPDATELACTFQILSGVFLAATFLASALDYDEE